MKRRTLPMFLGTATLVLTLGLGTSCTDEQTLGERVEEAGEEVGDEIDDHTN